MGPMIQRCSTVTASCQLEGSSSARLTVVASKLSRPANNLQWKFFSVPILPPPLCDFPSSSGEQTRYLILRVHSIRSCMIRVFLDGLPFVNARHTYPLWRKKKKKKKNKENVETLDHRGKKQSYGTYGMSLDSGPQNHLTRKTPGVPYRQIAISG